MVVLQPPAGDEATASDATSRPPHILSQQFGKGCESRQPCPLRGSKKVVGRAEVTEASKEEAESVRWRRDQLGETQHGFIACKLDSSGRTVARVKEGEERENLCRVAECCSSTTALVTP